MKGEDNMSHFWGLGINGEVVLVEEYEQGLVHGFHGRLFVVSE